jgi:hypothetical protein
MIKNEMINLFDMVASIGVEATSGIINDIDGLNEGLFELFDGFEEEGGFEEIANVTTYEEGCKEVIGYFEEYCLNEDTKHELDELKDLLVQLKEKANGRNVKWVLWSIETDIALGFIG